MWLIGVATEACQKFTRSKIAMLASVGNSDAAVCACCPDDIASDAERVEAAFAG